MSLLNPSYLEEEYVFNTNKIYEDFCAEKDYQSIFNESSRVNYDNYRQDSEAFHDERYFKKGMNFNNNVEDLKRILDLNKEDIDMEVIGKETTLNIMEELHFKKDSYFFKCFPISTNIQEDSTELSSVDFLTEHLKNTLVDLNIERLFPVQNQIIPFLKNPNTQFSDVCICAPTGSGKTLAYLLPIIEYALTMPFHPNFFCLILAPTFDLSNQIKNILEKLVKNTSIKIQLLSPLQKLEKEKAKLIKKNANAYIINCDILVSTPGRLVEHLKSTNFFEFSTLRFLVLDEADKLLDVFFDNWLSLLYSKIHQNLNSLGFKFGLPVSINENNKGFIFIRRILVSASISLNPRLLLPLNMNRTVLFHIDLEDDISMDKNMNNQLMDKRSLLLIPKELNEFIIYTESLLKPLVFLQLLTSLVFKQYNNKQKGSIILCFVNTVESVQRLCYFMKMDKNLFKNTNIFEFTSRLSANKRKKYIKQLENTEKSIKPTIIISTDIMSRGIDFHNIQSVINYDCPINIKQYVHRVGRTARATFTGSSYTLLDEKESIKFFSSIDSINRFKKLHERTITKNELPNDLLETYKCLLKRLSKYIKKQKILEKSSFFNKKINRNISRNFLS